MGRRYIGDVGVSEDFAHDVPAANRTRLECGCPERRAPFGGSRRRAASAVGSGLGGGVGASIVGCTVVFRSAALFEDCVRGVDMGCHQGGIGPVRDVRVQLCHVVLQSLSGPGPARRSYEYERSVAWRRSVTKRCRVRVKCGGWSPYPFGLCGRIRHTMSPSAPGREVHSRCRGRRGFCSRCPSGEAYPVRARWCRARLRPPAHAAASPVSISPAVPSRSCFSMIVAGVSWIGDPALGDAILDRLVHDTCPLNLKESMRKTRGPLTHIDHHGSQSETRAASLRPVIGSPRKGGSESP